MNPDRARNWQNKPFKPAWLEPLTMQRTGDLKAFRIWLSGNIPVMRGTDIIKARKMRSAVVSELGRRKQVRRNRIEERAAYRKNLANQRGATE